MLNLKQVENPFKGLDSYDENEPLYGRESDLILMRDRVYSGRTTLLFAASGVGKSSFLRAKLLRNLKKDFLCCYINDWSIPDARAAVADKIRAVLGLPHLDGNPALAELLQGFLKPPPKYPEGFLLVLDQFEEVFQYHAYRPGFPLFIDELCELIKRPEIHARVILCMRDDFLGELSVFDNRTPDLFNNYYRLKNPSVSEAVDIIRRTTGQVPEMKVDPKKLGALVEDLSVFERGISNQSTLSSSPESKSHVNDDSDQGRQWIAGLRDLGRVVVRLWRQYFVGGPKEPAKPAVVQRNFVVPPYLQIVCRELWNVESAGSKGRPFMFPASYQGNHEAGAILKRFCRERLDKLGTKRRKDLASRAFDFLMTREGAKMAYESKRLAEHMNVDEAELLAVLDDLSQFDTRLLRRYTRPDGTVWFELYHDMYAPIVYDWKRDYQTERARDRKVGLVSWSVGIAAIVAVVLLVNRATDSWSSIDRAVKDYPKAAYEDLLRNPLFRFTADGYLASYWDRRAAAAELDEKRDHALLFRLRALKLEDTAVRRKNANYLVTSYKGLIATFRMNTAVRAVSISRDEKLIATGSENGTVQIWDVSTSQPLQTFLIRKCSDLDPNVRRFDDPRPVSPEESTPDPVVQLVFSQDGKFLAARRSNGRAQVGDLREHTCQPLWAGTAELAFSPSGRDVAVGYAVGRVEIYRLGRNDPDFVVQHPLVQSALRRDVISSASGLTLSSIMFAGHGRTLYTTGSDGSTFAWDIQTRRGRRLIAKADSVTLNSDASEMVVIDQGQAKLWRVDPPKVIADLGEADESAEVRFSPDGRRALLSSDKNIVFNAESGERIASWPIFPQGAALSPDGSLIAISQAAAVALLNPVTGLVVEPLLITDGASSVEFSPSGQSVVTAGDVAQLWSIGVSGKTPSPLEGQSSRIELSQSGTRTAAMVGTRTVEVGNTVSDSQIANIDAPADIQAMAFNGDGSMLAACLADGSAMIWSAESGDRFAGPFKMDKVDGKPTCRGVIFSPRGDALITMSGPSQFQLWRVSPQRELLTSTGTAEFTPDGETVAVRNPQSLTLYRAKDGSKIASLGLSSLLPRPVYDANTKRLAASTGREVLFADWSSGKLSLSLAVRATGLAIRPGGHEFAFLSDYQTLNVWDSKSGRESWEAKYSEPIGRLIFQPAIPNHYLLTTNRFQSALQLWNLDSHKPAGDKAQLPHRIRQGPTFAPGGNRVLAATPSWVHSFAVTGTGSMIDTSRPLPGVPRPSQSIVFAGSDNIVAMLLQIGPATRLALVDLRPESGEPLAGKPDDLVQSWQSKLAVRIDDKGNPVTLLTTDTASERRRTTPGGSVLH